MNELDQSVTRDIDRHVDRLLADLKGLPPPLPIAAVCDLLKLDRSYYSAHDVSAIGGMVHRMRIAKRQLIQRPMLLVDVIRKLDLKALWLPDQRLIAIDSSLPAPKQRWAEGHEIVHSILPWHETFTQGDQHRTLRLDCYNMIEAEANHGASRLLFMGGLFSQHFDGNTVTFSEISRLSKLFRNSLAATHWRCVSHSRQALVGVISTPPWDSGADAGKVRHVFCSASYREQFGPPCPVLWAGLISTTLKRRRGGPCGEEEYAVASLSGEQHGFIVSCFNTQHAILTIAAHRGALPSIG